MDPEKTEDGVEVPYELLSADVLDKLLTEYVLREGTDYGAVEASLERKISDLKRQLEKRELTIVFDLASETGSLRPTHARKNGGPGSI